MQQSKLFAKMKTLRFSAALFCALALAFLFWQALPGMPGYVKAGMAAFIALAHWLVFTRFVTPVVFWMAGLLLLACAGGGTLHL